MRWLPSIHVYVYIHNGNLLRVSPLYSGIKNVLIVFFKLNYILHLKITLPD